MLRLIKWIKIPALKNIVGQIINWNKKPYKVVGVVKEMVMQLPYEPVQPTIFSMDPGSANIITVRIKPTMSMQAALDKIETVFKNTIRAALLNTDLRMKTMRKSFLMKSAL
jgi:hypothetical protein